MFFCFGSEMEEFFRKAEREYEQGKRLVEMGNWTVDERSILEEMLTENRLKIDLVKSAIRLLEGLSRSELTQKRTTVLKLLQNCKGDKREDLERQLRLFDMAYEILDKF